MFATKVKVNRNVVWQHAWTAFQGDSNQCSDRLIAWTVLLEDHPLISHVLVAVMPANKVKVNRKVV
jgi:hypothetical protein